MSLPAVDATRCAVCLDDLDPHRSVVLLVDGWSHVLCADIIMTMEPPC